MLTSNSVQKSISARICEYFSANQPWNRRIWNTGSILGLDELLEAIDAVAEGVLSEESANYLANALIGQAGPDLGFGDNQTRSLVRQQLQGRPLRPDSISTRAIRQLVREIKPRYLKNWASALRASGADELGIELPARSIASHLLDIGYSSNFLLEWWSIRCSSDWPDMSLPELLEEAAALSIRSQSPYRVLLLFDSIPRESEKGADNWISAKDSVEWLRGRGHSVRSLRIAGGLLLSVEALDKWAAVERARETADHLLARAADRKSLGPDSYPTALD